MDAAQIMRQALQAGRYDSLHNDAFSAQQSAQAAVQSGQAMGYTFNVVQDPNADLQDSLEELTFQFEEKEMKSIGERKLGQKHSEKSAYITAVEKWMKTLPDLPGGAFMERMLRQLRQAHAQGALLSQQQVLKMLREGSSDPTCQFAMLEILEEAASQDAGELGSLVSQTKQALLKEKGTEIRAGINIASQINAQAASPEEMQSLRDLYRGEVLGFSTPQDCFKSLIAQRGPGKLGEAIEFLLKGCGIDLQSPNPSMSREELHRILGDLQCVQVLKTVMDKLGALAGKMGTQFGERPLLNGEKLTGRVMDFTTMPFVTSSNIASLIASCGLGKLLAQIYFCTGLIDIFRGLSPRLFSQESDRFRLEDAAQEHLDGLVGLQEEAEQQSREGSEEE